MAFEADFSSAVSIAAFLANQALLKILDPAAKLDKGCALYLPHSFVREVEFLSDFLQIFGIVSIQPKARIQNGPLATSKCVNDFSHHRPGGFIFEFLAGCLGSFIGNTSA